MGEGGGVGWWGGAEPHTTNRPTAPNTPEGLGGLVGGGVRGGGWALMDILYFIMKTNRC